MNDDPKKDSKPIDKQKDTVEDAATDHNHNVNNNTTTDQAAAKRDDGVVKVVPAKEIVREDVHSDSEAETVVLPGKEDVSPHHPRKAIKHEGKDEVLANINDVKSVGGDKSKCDEQPDANGNSKRKKATKDGGTNVVTETHNSSNLSSTISSPILEQRPPSRAASESAQSRSKQSHDSDAHSKGSTSRKRKVRNDDSEEKVQRRRQKRESSLEHTERTQSERKDRRDNRKVGEHRSESPPRHRNRTHSLSSSSHPGVQKRRKPPPLNVGPKRRRSEEPEGDTDDSDSTRGHPHLRKLLSTEAAMSPAKMPHKKLRDKNGRTWLARACATEDVDYVVARLKERPEDLDVADNAGNTPLQIAALEGNYDIVKVLLENNCDIHCKNIDSDTPLIDAVENGHVDVIKLLLKAGVDPRQGNAKGEEPLDLLNQDDENYAAIRTILQRAKEKGNRRRPSDEHQGNLHTGRESLPARSPRESPSLNSARSPPPLPMPRRRTARSEATRNDLLWVNATPENLRERAAIGDETGVDHILNMKAMGDIEAVLAAAKGGHEVCLQLLIAIGKPKHDPEPLASPYKEGYNTPMLAAIGRGNLRVIQLLLDQHDFDPARRLYDGLTYHEISKQRKGANWQEEYNVLKSAYDKVKGKVSNGSSPSSTRSSQSQRGMKKQSREHASASPLRPSKRDSPDRATKEGISRKKSSVDTKSSVMGNRREQDGDNINKKLERTSSSGKKHLRVPSKRESREVSTTVSDREASPVIISEDNKTKRSISDDEAHDKNLPRPRKRLISRKALEDNAANKRRASLVSVASSSSSQEQARSKSALPPSIKREKSESKETSKLPSLETAKKRARPSVSPSEGNSPNSHKSPDTTKKIKRQRVGSDHGKSSAQGTSPPSTVPGPARVANMGCSASTQSSDPGPAAGGAPVAFMGSSSAGQSKEAKPVGSETQPLTATTVTIDTSVVEESTSTEAKVDREAEGGETEMDDLQAQASIQLKSETEATVAAAASAEAAAKAEEAARQQELKDKRETEERKEKERVLERVAREEAERIAREEEATRQEERRQAEEAERKAQQEREEEEARQERKRKEEEMARRQAERERQRKEELERQERRRVEQEERERLAKLKRQEEEERQRRQALPNALRIAAELSPDAARHPSEILRWLPIYTATGYQLDTRCDESARSERWIANIQAAPILGITDLDLSQCKPHPPPPARHLSNPELDTAWQKRQASDAQRMSLWRVLRLKMARYEWGPLEFYNVNDEVKADLETVPKFFALERIFWIRLSDFTDIVPRHPHLANLTLKTAALGLKPEDGSADKVSQPNGIHASATTGPASHPQLTLLNGNGGTGGLTNGYH